MNEALRRNLSVRERVRMGVTTPAEELEEVARHLVEEDGYESPEDAQARTEEVEQMHADAQAARDALRVVIVKLQEYSSMDRGAIDEIIDDLEAVDTQLWEIA